MSKSSRLKNRRRKKSRDKNKKKQILSKEELVPARILDGGEVSSDGATIT